MWINFDEVLPRLAGLEKVEDAPIAEFAEDELPEWITTSFICRLAKQLSSMVTLFTKKDFYSRAFGENDRQNSIVEQSAFDVEMDVNNEEQDDVDNKIGVQLGDKLDLNRIEFEQDNDCPEGTEVMQSEVLHDSRVQVAASRLLVKIFM